MPPTIALFKSSVLVFCFALSAGAQDAPPVSNEAGVEASRAQSAQTEAPAAQPSAKLILKEGTEVKLKLAQDLSSKLAIEGDPVMLVLAEDLKVGETTVAKAGAKALGTVTRAKKAGMMGRPGELSLRLEYLIVRNSRMRLRGTKGKEGQGKVGTVVALTILFGPIGLIKHGKNVEVKEGTPLLAYVDQDFVVPEGE